MPARMDETIRRDIEATITADADHAKRLVSEARDRDESRYYLGVLASVRRSLEILADPSVRPEQFRKIRLPT